MTQNVQMSNTCSLTIIIVITKFCQKYHWDTLSLPSCPKKGKSNIYGGQEQAAHDLSPVSDGKTWGTFNDQYFKTD